MVMFRCKRSGNTISVTDSVAIAELMKHESYDKVIPDLIEMREDQPLKMESMPSHTLKLKRGRPPKEKTV